jgi:hypothetical protein
MLPDPDPGKPNQSGSGSTKLIFSRTGLATVPVYSYRCSRYSEMHPIFDYQLKNIRLFFIGKGETEIEIGHMRDINELHCFTGGAEVRALQAIPRGLVFPDAEVSLT